jgi:hypothetical protein
MKEILVLKRLDFDNLENDAPEISKEIAAFADDAGGTAYAKIKSYLAGKSFAPYIGYNKQIYPQFVIESFSS